MTTQPEAAVEVLRSRGIIEPVEVGISGLSGLISLRRHVRAFLKTKEEDWGARLRRDETR
jgi:hypothetical protein